MVTRGLMALSVNQQVVAHLPLRNLRPTCPIPTTIIKQRDLKAFTVVLPPKMKMRELPYPYIADLMKMSYFRSNIRSNV